MSPCPKLLLSTVFAATLMAGCASNSTQSTELIRYKIPGSSFPISNAVEVPAGVSTVYLSGKVPAVLDKSKASTDPAAFGGDTEGQTVNVLKNIDAQLKAMGLSMSDVIKMQVFLVKDPAKGNKMDFAGFMKGYTQFFGTTEQPNLPSRSAFEIAALANPAWLVEIEVVAVRGAKNVVK
ncbi:RidA family protein [Comamonas aquatica]|uniref:RidA family protein n=1 Tax=Comamonas aquatica TaxID=225991 RepID=A0AA42W131_9BURK|nr:RidA family protein [Comamonas aquatica]MDH1429716.1 RidA family protein [Comamonas aquatica]MDH1605316.1 RidA family protein [Comamonas aquatica]MDH1616935.1 RidA family protein [Comamonas aquatica]MDH2005357.1 RidA family protein [Comamonas aquatica]